MLNGLEIIELEKRLFAYRIKKKIPYFIFFMLVFILMGAFIYIFFPQWVHFFGLSSSRDVSSPIALSKEINDTSNMPLTLLQETNASIPSSLDQDKNTTEESLVLKLPEIKYNASIQTKNSNTQSVSDIQEEEMYTKPIMRKPPDKEDDSFYRSRDDKIDGSLLPPPPLEDVKPQGIIKIETHVINSLPYLKEKFDSTHRIVYALMLAEEYYKNKNYNESNKWALIANNLDAENEKSWIWFAKSKYKLGYKDDAILALKTFLKSHQSKELQVLLDQILSDTINE